MKALILKLVEPISKFIAIFSVPESDADDSELAELKALIKDGDVLLSYKNWELSNLLMPGQWKHAAVYSQGHVYEQVTKGAQKVSLEEFFFKKDKIGLCRWDEAPVTTLPQAVDFLETQVKKKVPYNWSFNVKNTDVAYCSQLCYNFLCRLFVDFKNKFKCSTYFGEEVVKPTDLWDQLKHIGQWQ